MASTLARPAGSGSNPVEKVGRFEKIGATFCSIIEIIGLGLCLGVARWIFNARVAGGGTIWIGNAIDGFQR